MLKNDCEKIGKDKVKDCLLKLQQIKQERIFLVSAELISQEKPEGISAARVDLNLK